MAPIVFGDRTICRGVSVGAALSDGLREPVDSASRTAAQLLAAAAARHLT
ncbi:MAG: hypothetical protein H7233_10725 [Pseudorhodobacter sp.]|nr:hypothetical protein [Frankiaceae bacterium]